MPSRPLTSNRLRRDGMANGQTVNRPGWIAGLLLLTIAAGVGPAWSEDDVVVRVNGTPIMRSAVRDVVKAVIASSRDIPGGREVDRLSEEALDSLIDLELLYQDARSRNITVAPAEVDAAIARAREHFDAEDYSAALARRGLSEADLHEATRKTLIVNRLLQTVVWSEIRISRDAVEAFYAESRHEPRGQSEPSAAMREQIARVLESEERQRRRAAFVAELRKGARIEYPIEPVTPGQDATHE
jgi:hypothetical protein